MPQSRFTGAMSPVSLTPLRVAWKIHSDDPSRPDSAFSLAVDGTNLQVEIDGTLHTVPGFFGEIPDAVFKMIAPYTSAWKTMAEAGCVQVRDDLAEIKSSEIR